MKVARNEKRKKLLGFSFYINIGKFEAFLWNLNLSANRLFWRCVYKIHNILSNLTDIKESFKSTLTYHTSEIRDLGLIKLASKML